MFPGKVFAEKGKKEIKDPVIYKEKKEIGV